MSRLRTLIVMSIGVAVTGCQAEMPLPSTQYALPPSPLTGQWIRVVEGQSLQTLARIYRVPIVDLEELNGIDRADALEVDSELFIPDVPQHVGDAVVAGTIESGSPKPVVVAPGAMIWPVPGGKLSSRFGRRDKRIHEGVDIAAPRGTPVVAAAAGEVIYSGGGIRGYGNLVIVKHQGGIVTVYAHNHRNNVERGAQVTQGQVIAEVGNTGRSTGNHLHFEVRVAEKPRDPLKFVAPPQ